MVLNLKKLIKTQNAGINMTHTKLGRFFNLLFIKLQFDTKIVAKFTTMYSLKTWRAVTQHDKNL